MSSLSAPEFTLNWIAANKAAESHAPFVDIFMALFGMECRSGNDVVEDIVAVLAKIKELAEQENRPFARAWAAAGEKSMRAYEIEPDPVAIARVFDHLIKTAHNTSVSKGFWKLRETVVWPVSPEDGEIAIHVMLSRLMLISSEVVEAAEAVRDGKYVTVTENGKPEGVLAELADVQIRVFDLLGVVEEITQESFADVLMRKMAYNATRPMMHGKKA